MSRIPCLRLAGPFMLMVGLASCAKEEPPPGTGPDSQAPRPMQLRPAYGERVPGFDGSASIRFDEPLANPRNLGRDLVGSPAGRYVVKPGRRGLDIEPADGWREGVVYFLSLPAGISDLLRNQTTRPVEWLFSTGGDVPDTEVSGRLIERVSAQGRPGLRVLFLSADSVPYTAVSDTGGIYRLPGLPPGEYEAVGFQDQDRDFTYDAAFEPGGIVRFAIGSDAPRPEVDVLLLPADSTAPVLLEAVARDSVTLRLTFDDPLDPDAELADISIAVRDSALGTDVAIDTFAVGDLAPVAPPEDGEGGEPEAEAEGAADGAAEGGDAEGAEGEADGGEADGGGEADDGEAAAALGELAPGAAAAARDALGRAAGQGIPGLDPAPDYLTLRVARPFAVATYRVEVAGVPNLRLLAGGGTVSFAYEPPPRPPAPAVEGEEGADGEVGSGADDEGEGEPGGEPDEADEEDAP